ncbi:MAG TPA: hypothetical protein [Caudoviricetes sp.]|nr:MAG TPA: hypothetical protein [Caudoviricetes sp.]
MEVTTSVPCRFTIRTKNNWGRIPSSYTNSILIIFISTGTCTIY